MGFTGKISFNELHSDIVQQGKTCLIGRKTMCIHSILDQTASECSLIVSHSALISNGIFLKHCCCIWMNVDGNWA